jgi:hypothetical protein
MAEFDDEFQGPEKASTFVEGLHRFRALWERIIPARWQAGGHSATPVMVFGQSHMKCLARAWSTGAYRPEGRRLRHSFVLRGRKDFPSDGIVVKSPATGEDAVHPQLARTLREHVERHKGINTWLVSVIRGNDYNMMGLFDPDPPYDFVHPDLPSLPVRDDAPLVPYDAVKKRMGVYADRTRRFYKCLPREGVAGVLHVEAPPPIPSREQCERAVERVFLQRTIGAQKNARISPREFRMKLWRCQSDLNRAICRETGVIYVSPPEEALDAEGYLLPEAWFGATHASKWYGVHLLRKIERMILEQSRLQDPSASSISSSQST